MRDRVRYLTKTALTAALICAAAPFAIPVGAVPVSLATLAVAVGAAVTGAASGVTAVILYLVLGAVGLPVFSGFMSGAAHIAGPTGGFLLGYIPFAFICGKWGGSPRPLTRASAFTSATLLLYVTGALWYCLWSHCSPTAAVTFVLPAVPGDLLKIAAATALCGNNKLSKII